MATKIWAWFPATQDFLPHLPNAIQTHDDIEDDLGDEDGAGVGGDLGDDDGDTQDFLPHLPNVMHTHATRTSMVLTSEGFFFEGGHVLEQ